MYRVFFNLFPLALLYKEADANIYTHLPPAAGSLYTRAVPDFLNKEAIDLNEKEVTEKKAKKTVNQKEKRSRSFLLVRNHLHRKK